jgi:hypothetical protein
MNTIIGVDFDNTIVSYDEVIYEVAVEQGLVPPDVNRSKKGVRDQIRQLPDGDIEWQKVQAIVYGPKMGRARLIAGVSQFFKQCRQHRIEVYIVSHKTEYAHYDKTRTNLRQAALGWMAQYNFFEAAGLGLSRQQVYFGSTRREKIEHIQQLGCTHFIDDLEELFLEETFPTQIDKILYTPHDFPSALVGVRVMSSWKKINDYFFSGK